MSNPDTLNPSQENDVNALASMLQRASTFLVSQSKQAEDYQRQIQDLRTEIADVKDRVTSALAEGQRLRDELYRTVTERDAARREAEENRQLAESFSRDVTNTRNELQAARETIRSLDEDKANLERTLSGVRNEVVGLSHYRDTWRDAANSQRNRAEAAEAKLAKLQEQFKAIFEPAQEEQAPHPQEEQPKAEQSAGYWDNAGQHHS